MSVSWANIAAWLQDCTAKENGAQKMGRIFYIMGKSATGKDTVFKELLKRRPELTTVVPYTTRPIREGETDGVEYFLLRQKNWKRLKIPERSWSLGRMRRSWGRGAILPWTTASLISMEKGTV